MPFVVYLNVETHMGDGTSLFMHKTQGHGVELLAVLKVACVAWTLVSFDALRPDNDRTMIRRNCSFVYSYT